LRVYYFFFAAQGFFTAQGLAAQGLAAQGFLVPFFTLALAAVLPFLTAQGFAAHGFAAHGFFPAQGFFCAKLALGTVNNADANKTNTKCANRRFMKSSIAASCGSIIEEKPTG
jgi:hypothetical protein